MRSQNPIPELIALFFEKLLSNDVGVTIAAPNIIPINGSLYWVKTFRPSETCVRKL